MKNNIKKIIRSNFFIFFQFFWGDFFCVYKHAHRTRPHARPSGGGVSRGGVAAAVGFDLSPLLCILYHSLWRLSTPF